jgi:superfamily II DNA or RNA helicase
MVDITLGDHLISKVFEEFKYLKRANQKTNKFMDKLEKSSSLKETLYCIDRIEAFTTDQKVCNRNIRSYQKQLLETLKNNFDTYKSKGIITTEEEETIKKVLGLD